jgi:hypothetical protein
MESLKKKFKFEELIKISHQLQGEDYIFGIEKIPSLKGFIEVHQEVKLQQDPLILRREIILTSIVKTTPNIRLKLFLCWNGYKEAINLLFNLPRLYERVIPLEKVINITQVHEIGDSGFGWTWQESKKEPDIILFVRNNVVVSIEGQFKEHIELNIAKEIDNELKKLQTIKEYPIEQYGLFSNVRKAIDEIPKVQAGGRLAIGKNPTKEQQLFFATTSGTINRDITNPDQWYYRAGMERGAHQITVYRIANGILPKKEMMTIEIVQKEV